ncbi:uncharacterized protein LOC134192149 [Corticium candelabrum]|uniref:uncharacterized protein LOC134192149 n=1 Tax=Corticium candelabrum TaxID=121492 RepID=UPI002E256139|nr:uncharacterized protein LOC134192149 [Corticium candelabrum]
MEFVNPLQSSRTRPKHSALLTLGKGRSVSRSIAGVSRPQTTIELAASTSDLTIDTTSVAESFRHQADGASVVTEHNEKDCNVTDDILTTEAELKTYDDDLQHMMSVLQRRSATKDKLVTQYRSKVEQLETKISQQDALLKKKEDEIARLRNEARHAIKKARNECASLQSQLIIARKQIQQQATEISDLKVLVKKEKARGDKAQADLDKRGLEVQRLTEELASAKEENNKLIEVETEMNQNIEEMKKFTTTFFQKQENLRHKVVEQKTHESLQIMQPHVVVADATTPGLAGTVTVHRVLSQQTESLWEQRVRPHFDSITRALSPKKILPKLYSNKLIDHNEFSSLSGSKQSEQDIATELLRDILIKKGDDAFGKFCATLRDVEGQREIADFIDPRPTV